VTHTDDVSPHVLDGNHENGDHDTLCKPTRDDVPEFDDTLNLMAITVGRMNTFIMQGLREEGVRDIVPSHGGILRNLFQSGHATMGELARSIGRDPSTVTALVHKLKGLGYVAMERDTLDSRVNIVTLTERGRELEPAFSRVSRKWRTVQAETLSPGERGELHDMLCRLYDAYEPDKASSKNPRDTEDPAPQSEKGR
jgi:DNA-binding MarR family transcriptional regulator